MMIYKAVNTSTISPRVTNIKGSTYQWYVRVCLLPIIVIYLITNISKIDLQLPLDKIRIN